MTIADNYRDIRHLIEKACIRRGRDPNEVRLLGASKTVEPEAIKEAVACGLDLIGENTVQEAEEKFPHLLKVERHFIGHLQSNKTRKAVELFDCIQSVDSLKLARSIDRHAGGLRKKMPVFLEVNIAQEESKSGFRKEELEDALEDIRKLPNIEVKGLMCIPPYEKEPEVARPYFRTMRMLREYLGLELLSMGMSNDFEIAVEEGADIVRIGTSLFGKRL